MKKEKPCLWAKASEGRICKHGFNCGACGYGQSLLKQEDKKIKEFTDKAGTDNVRPDKLKEPMEKRLDKPAAGPGNHKDNSGTAKKTGI
ncbi:MAG: hypothetical protein WC980_10005 [Candidatus Brocadiia bacterium]